ncbi:HAMP domain-containing protein [Vallitalea pronyensis]|uniref:histidine kinase n=1 Tax=Vallitalea pronyensis TaxID=1348613 RepID=A0A8J8SGV7_9FIRM|nr:ATP-binding protein [Vallitalea pronyensis]QUI22723.1 HAMP domain-containing protein [Vallitalea pronyensis]
MQKKLMTTYLFIISVTMVVAIIISWHKGNEHIQETIQKDTQVQGILLLELLKKEPEGEAIDFQAYANWYAEQANVRLTIIDKEGTVVADSDEDYQVMDNHAYRDEVAEALKGRTVSRIRYSKTIGIPYLYTAMPMDLANFDGVLRISVPLTTVKNSAMEMVRYVLYGILIGAIIAIVVAFLVTRRFMEPLKELTDAATRISEGDYDNKIYMRHNDERGKLAHAFNEMTIKLKLNMWNLRKRNEEFEAVLSSMINGLIAVDEQYHVFLANEQAKAILGVEGSLLDKSIYEVIRNTTIYHVLEKSIEQQEYIVDDTIIADEKERVIRVYANPIYKHKSASRTLGTLLVIQDVTDIRKLETMRKDFVSNVTHELNTPLTSIRGFVDTLKHGAISDEKIANRFLDIIDIETERLSLLIQDILSLSAIESTDQDKRVDEYDIKEIIDEVLDILEPKIKKKNIEIINDINQGLTYRCNRDRIKQLFINLLDNAIKYTEKGQVGITCSRDEQGLKIDIWDTGIGIEEEHIPRLFERFYRVDKGRSRNMGGTGLGLSIVKHIVELYKGRIDVVSRVGEGSRFVIFLPYGEVNE